MRIYVGLLMSLVVGVAHANADLTAAIENVRTTCGNISAELTDMKKMAGITTAVTGVGTVAGGVALGTGIAKAGVDKDIEAKEKLPLLSIGNEQTFRRDLLIYAQQINQITNGKNEADEQKSKTLGSIRTGTLAVATATNIAGAVMSGHSSVRNDANTGAPTVGGDNGVRNFRIGYRIDGNVNGCGPIDFGDYAVFAFGAGGEI